MVRISLGLVLLLALGAMLTLGRTRWAEARFPAEGAFLDLPGVRLHYLDRRGSAIDAPTLVLLHGASTNLRDFHALSEALGPHNRLVSVDRPGAGYSRLHREAWFDPAAQARAVAQLLEHLGIDDAVWVGHSLAGALVMAGLLDHPGRARAGILLAGVAYPWTGGVDFAYRLPGYPVVGPLATHTLVAPLGQLMIGRGLAEAFAPEAVTPDYRRRSGIELYLRPAHFVATARDMRRLSDYLARQSLRYAEIRQPLLVVHGDSDDIVPAWNHAERLSALLPQVRYRRISGGGHQPHHVHAVRVAEWIHGFLDDGVDAPSGDK